MDLLTKEPTVKCLIDFQQLFIILPKIYFCSSNLGLVILCGWKIPVIFILNNPLVPLQLILERCLVHGQVATFAGELLQGLLRFFNLLAQRFNLLIVDLDLIVIVLLCVFDGLLQHSSLKGETEAEIT